MIIVLIIIFYFILELIFNFFMKHKIKNIVRFKFQKYIFRTIDDNNVPFLLYEKCHRKWAQLNPDYNIVWFSNKECDDFMRGMRSDIYEAYNRLLPGAYKADLWRLCILEKYGGVYVDAYCEPYESLDSILKNTCSFVSVLDAEQSGSGIHNGFIYSERNHPFLRDSIENIVKNVQKKFYGKTPLDITGPILLSETIKKCITNKGYKFKNHKIGLNRYGEFSYFLFEFKYGPKQNVYKNNKKIFSKYFSFLYYLYRKSKKDGYYKLWNKRKVYS